VQVVREVLVAKLSPPRANFRRMVCGASAATAPMKDIKRRFPPEVTAMFRLCSSFLSLPALGAVLAASFLSPPSAAHAAGLETYSAAKSFEAGEVVLGADGNTYRATRGVKAIDPVTSRDGDWQLAYAADDLVIDVPGRFKTINAAWEFLAGARIVDSATVTVQLAPGDYPHDKPLVLNHAEGARITLRGSGEKSEACRLLFAGTEGIVVDRGHVLAIENLTIKSPSTEGFFVGLVVKDRSSATASNCQFDDCSILAEGSARVVARRCAFAISRNGDAVGVKNGSSGLFTDCVAVSKRQSSTAKDWVGFLAYNGGSLTCVGCRAEGWRMGFQGYCNGAMTLDSCVGRNNGIGASTEYSSSMNVLGCEFSENAGGGVAAICGATASVIGCRLVNNGQPNFVDGNAYLNFIDKPTTIEGSRIGVEARAGGRMDLKMAVFKNVTKKVNVGDGPGDLPIDQAFVNAP